MILGVSAILGAIVIGSARENPSATNTIPEASPVEAAPEQSYEGMVVAIEVGEKSLMDLRKFKEWATVLARAERKKRGPWSFGSTLGRAMCGRRKS